MAILQEAMPLRFHFANRAAAERAGALLHSRTGCEARLGVTENDHVVTVPRVEASRREAVRAVMEAEGGRRLAGEDSAHAPRPVQPGFTDAAPGIVPDWTETAAENPEDYEDPGAASLGTLSAPKKP